MHSRIDTYRKKVSENITFLNLDDSHKISPYFLLSNISFLANFAGEKFGRYSKTYMSQLGTKLISQPILLLILLEKETNFFLS